MDSAVEVPWNSIQHVLSIPELLALIFVHCLPNDGDFVFASANSPPTVLALVCRRWSDIAFATPELWSSISLVEKIGMKHRRFVVDGTNVDQVVDVLSRWILRSRGHPFDFWLPLSETVYVMEPVPVAERRILEIVREIRHRWRKLDVACSATSGVRLLQTVGDETPALEDLSIRFPANHFVSPHVETERLRASVSIAGAPKLRSFKCFGTRLSRFDSTFIPFIDCSKIGPALMSLALRGCTVTFGRLDTLLPSTIHSLDIDIRDRAQAVKLPKLLLYAFCNLTELYIVLHAHTIPNHVGGGGVLVAELKHLTTLAITFGDNCSGIFYKLMVPSLQTLSLKVEGSFCRWEDVASMLRTSQSPLTSFSVELSYEYTYSDGLDEFLRDLAKVKAITFSAPSALSILLLLLTLRTTNGKQDIHPELSSTTSPFLLCPSLEVLECPISDSYVSDLALIDFIKSRCPQGAIEYRDTSRAIGWSQIRRLCLNAKRVCKRNVLSDPYVQRSIESGLSINWEA